MNCGLIITIENTAKPNTSAVTLVRKTVGTRIIRMSTTGWAARRSVTIQASTSSAAPTNRASTSGDVQPRIGPWLIPNSNAVSQPASSRPPGQETPPAGYFPDSGITMIAATSATTMTAAGNQNNQ